MFRLTQRLLSSSQFRKILTSESAEVFLKEVANKLQQSRSGQLTATGENVRYWDEITKQAEETAITKNTIDQLQTLYNDTSSEQELRNLAKEDLDTQEELFENIVKKLAYAVVPPTEMDLLTKCQIEFASGAGGQEAMLFTKELLDMYRSYAQYKGLKWEPLQEDDVSLGGIRNAVIAVSGPQAYSLLRFEAGIHRVQRIPVTDKSRMHTSTASVSVLPEPEEVSVIVPSDSVKIETMRASGPGGQNVNKRSTAVRMTHKETGIAVHCMDERFQHMNIQIAYKRLAAIIMQKKLDKMTEKVSSHRKLQVGSKARAEKIRTYNFQHDRITDHRIHMQLPNIENFMTGTEALDSMINRLAEEYLIERLRDIVDNCLVE